MTKSDPLDENNGVEQRLLEAYAKQVARENTLIG